MLKVECEVLVVDGWVRVVDCCAREDVGTRVVVREVRGVLVMLVT